MFDVFKKKFDGYKCLTFVGGDLVFFSVGLQVRFYLEGYDVLLEEVGEIERFLFDICLDREGGLREELNQIVHKDFPLVDTHVVAMWIDDDGFWFLHPIQ